MNRKQYRVLDQFKPGEWLDYMEVRQRYVDSTVADDDWGLISFVISFFSRHRAKAWFDLNTGVEVSITLSSLVAEGCLKREWFRRPEADIRKEADLYGYDLESMDKTSVDYRLLVRRARYQITEDGSRVRDQRPENASVSALADAT